MPKNPSPYILRHQVVARRFYKAFEAFHAKNGWTAQETAKNFSIPRRTVYNWLNKKSCPKKLRLRELCKKFRWSYEVMFGRQSVEDFLFEEMHLSVTTLNRRYLCVVSNDPLESWNYVSLAGAMVFNDMAAAGYECRATIDHNFGVRINFYGEQLSRFGLQVSAEYGRGIMIGWIDDNGIIRGEASVLSNSSLDLIKKTLHSYNKT